MVTVPQADRASERFPLCVRYAAIQLVVLRTQLCESGHATSCDLLWDFGQLHNGEYEVLGVWPAGAFGSGVAELVANDLVTRGVMQVALLLNGAADEVGDAILRAFPGTRVTQSFPPIAQKALSAAPSRARKAISTRPRRFEDVAWLLQKGVTRATERHGPFVSAQAAAVFAEEWLMNACRRRRRGQRLEGGRWRAALAAIAR
jgi:hypothetical protein